MRTISIIVAASENGTIGKDQKIPWKLRSDMRRFKEITTGHPVIMGRKTYESIGKPLPNRRNIVVSRSPTYTASGCEVTTSLQAAIELIVDGEVFICGGSSIYEEAFSIAEKLYLTRVHTTCEGDVFLTGFDPSRWAEISRQEIPVNELNEYDSTFVIYEKR
jgi:dihydrofolate reductase